MDSDDRILLTPGPVHIDRERWGQIAPLHHRTDEFRKLVLEIEKMLQDLAGTDSPAYLLTASGTGAMESAIANLASSGSSVLVVSGGKFGDRWNEIACRYGCRIDLIRSGPGLATDFKTVEGRILNQRYDLIAVTHVESSTGLLFDVERLSALLPEKRPLLVVDAIASLGSDRVEFDRWGIDILVGAGQKGLQAPPGISFAILSQRARRAAKKNAGRGYYLDYAKYDEGRESGDLPFTPAVQSFQLLHQSLKRILSEGKDKYLERQKHCSAVFTEAASIVGLELLAESPSVAVQAFTLPGGAGSHDMIESLARKEQIVVAGGQGELRGRIIRTGFPGLYPLDVLSRFISGVGRNLAGLGIKVDIERALKVLDSF